MLRLFLRLSLGTLALVIMAGTTFGQSAFSWQEVRDRFETANPTLRAGHIAVDESRAAEISAYLRPNPNLSVLADRIDPFSGGPAHGRSAFLLSSATISYLHERRHKRELCPASNQDATKIAVSSQADLERTLSFNLRGSFIQTLRGKAVLALAKENLFYYGQVLDVNRHRLKAGAIAQVDLDRLEIQRVQYESDFQAAGVNLRSAKIQLLAPLNDPRPVEQFDVTGPFGFSTQVAPLADMRQTSIDTRPDLRAAFQSVEKAKTDHRLAVANGSTDPTFAFDVGRNHPIDQCIGVGVSIPLRIFDRNQGEKLRTQLDIDRNNSLLDATRLQVLSDVDFAYATVQSSLILLQPYNDRYLQQASSIRDTISISYEHGAASLLEFLKVQAEYRAVQLNYLNLIASYYRRPRN